MSMTFSFLPGIIFCENNGPDLDLKPVFELSYYFGFGSGKLFRIPYGSGLATVDFTLPPLFKHFFCT